MITGCLDRIEPRAACDPGMRAGTIPHRATGCQAADVWPHSDPPGGQRLCSRPPAPIYLASRICLDDACLDDALPRGRLVQVRESQSTNL